MSDRGRSRSRSLPRDEDTAMNDANGSSNGNATDEEQLTLSITDEDAAFIVGRHGNTKQKIARVAGCELEIDEKATKLYVKGGTPQSRERGYTYCRLIISQRQGPVSIDFDESDRSDLTLLQVPTECVGYVTGKKGIVLRNIEEEWGTIMFFVADIKGQSSKADGVETLAIFGPDRSRRGAELKVMSATEGKSPGFYTSKMDLETPCVSDGLATDFYRISEEDYSYALGKEGSTRRKLATAAECVMEYIGRVAFLYGTREQRERVKQYLLWLCQQRTQSVKVDMEGRTDLTVVEVPTDYVGYITGAKGMMLRKLEDVTGTFCFIDSSPKEAGNEPETNEDKPKTERLLIFAAKEDSRTKARDIVLQRISDKQEGRRPSTILDQRDPPMGGDVYGRGPYQSSGGRGPGGGGFVGEGYGQYDNRDYRRSEATSHGGAPRDYRQDGRGGGYRGERGGGGFDREGVADDRRRGRGGFSDRQNSPPRDRRDGARDYRTGRDVSYQSDRRDRSGGGGGSRYRDDPYPRYDSRGGPSGDSRGGGGRFEERSRFEDRGPRGGHWDRGESRYRDYHSPASQDHRPPRRDYYDHDRR